MSDLPAFNYDKLDRQLDRVKSEVFMGKRSAFFGPLMSSIPFYWDTGIPTAATDGAAIWWNPEFFMEAPTKYGEPKFNNFVLRHELWHVAKFHGLRRNDREAEPWNFACDVRINGDLKKEGYGWGTFPAWYMPNLDHGRKEPMVEEDIYDHIMSSGMVIPANPWGDGEIMDPKSKDAARKQINNVVRAKTSAFMEGKEDEVPGGTQTLIDHFLAPIIPWEQQLKKWHIDLSRNKPSWRRPRRRMMAQGIYLPSHIQDHGRLAHLVYLQDVSGSISNPEIEIFNSELKYVWDYLKPKRMTVVQFDTKIHRVDEFHAGDQFTRIEITGRGGNDMWCVKNFLDNLEPRPTAAVIFTDLQFTPMEPLKEPIPLLWVVNNQELSPPFGDMIRIHVKQPRPFR